MMSFAEKKAEQEAAGGVDEVGEFESDRGPKLRPGPGIEVEGVEKEGHHRCQSKDGNGDPGLKIDEDALIEADPSQKLKEGLESTMGVADVRERGVYGVTTKASEPEGKMAAAEDPLHPRSPHPHLDTPEIDFLATLQGRGLEGSRWRRVIPERLKRGYPRTDPEADSKRRFDEVGYNECRCPGDRDCRG